MAQLAVFTADEYTSLQIVGAQASAVQPLDYRIGSDLRALSEGNTAALLYQQANILALLGLTRAATSVGTDLDSFFADFNFTRLPSTFATGVAQLHRDSTGTTVSVLADGSATFAIDGQPQQYIVMPDNSNPNYNSSTKQYTAAAGINNLNVTVQADTAGTLGNLPINTELLLSGTTSGFDNALAVSGFANGQDAETDAAFRTRFVLYLKSLARGTKDAIGAAILSVQSNLTYTISNNVDPAGNYEPGNFVVTVDDGSGSPPASLLAAVDAAVTAYQANTVSHSVRPPSVANVTVSLMLVFSKAAIPANELTAITAAVINYVNTLPLGAGLSVTRLSNVVYVTSSNVTNVSVLLNGGTNDITASPAQTIKLQAGGLTVNYTIAAS